MKYVLLGLNHKTAPVELRERFPIAEKDLPQALNRFLEHGAEEAFILCTCNRVEFLARGSEQHPDVSGFVSSYLNLNGNTPLETFTYLHKDHEAMRHLFRVASSLDSMVLGEPQILGQVKEAYALARSVGSVHSHLDSLLTRSFAVAKRVRTESSIGSSAVSIASVAVELAKRIFGSLQGKTVLLVGAGKMSELAARHLSAHGANKLLVCNRTYERAAELAEKVNGQAVRYEDLYATAPQADIVLTSTGAPEPIFRREHGQEFQQRRRNRPMFFIDIAVPRDVASEMNTVEGIFVYDIDDLQNVISSHTAGRRLEAEKAERIIEEEGQRFDERLQTLAVVPTIVSLQDHLETIRQAEVDKGRGRLGSLNPEQELALEAMTRGIINKLLHTPITAMKSAASRESEPTTLLEAIRRIFNLPEKTDKGEKKASGQN